jgi:transketolase
MQEELAFYTLIFELRGNMDTSHKEILQKIANTIRALSIEGVQKANSGHPGLPLGCAEFGAYLYGHLLKHNPKNPDWFNRDRMVLSAGHGSMWLYSCMHLAGYESLPMEELKKFRQLNSKTPGHPESLDTKGVEVTTGPLGQGVANAIGMALGTKMLAHKFNRPGFDIFDNKIYCLAGDGCLMEGVSQESSSLAGHLDLDNLILVYDDNKVTLDGYFSQSSSEDVGQRYRAYGWDVVDVKDGNDLEQIDAVFSAIKKQTKPILVRLHTVIGKGSPNKEGTNSVHGAPLGPEELELTKKNLGLAEEDFFVDGDVRAFFEKRLKKDEDDENAHKKILSDYQAKHPDLFKELQEMKGQEITKELRDAIYAVEMGEKEGGRKAGQKVLQAIADHFAALIGGSADLSVSDCTMLQNYPIVSRGDFAGRNIKYGVREFGMAAMANGLSTLGFFRPFVGTFFCFSDYMKNAVRLAALSKHPVTFVYTHDSICLGEDGPTHQPVEHLAGLRAMPNLHLFRPGDANEIKGSWYWIISQTGPTAIVLTRQNLPTLAQTAAVSFEDGVARGAYIVQKEGSGAIDTTLIATGSELSLALDVAEDLQKCGKNVRVVSMPCMELFEEQPQSYKDSILGGDIGLRVSVETGASFGWGRYTGLNGINISIDTFGRSAPMADVLDFFGFTRQKIVARIQKVCQKEQTA